MGLSEDKMMMSGRVEPHINVSWLQEQGHHVAMDASRWSGACIRLHNLQTTRMSGRAHTGRSEVLNAL